MVYLFGASGHAKVIIEILENENEVIGGLIDLNPNITKLFSYQVWKIIPESFNYLVDSAIVSIGNNYIRKKVVEELNLSFKTAIHFSSNVSKSTIIGEGTVIMSGVSINADTLIGNHVILNTNCSVDHDCVLQNFVHISPNVALAGNVEVGEGSHIGIGANVIQNIKIGKWVIIGAGTVVIKDIPDYAVVVGNPGKIIKYNIENE